jgi:hypothetical protein
MRGRPPAFFEGDASVITGLRFNVEDETFEFHAPAKMREPSHYHAENDDLKSLGVLPQ